MIGFLRGRVADKGESGCLLDVGGVGYRLACSGPTLAALPALGDEARLWTHLHVREDELSLYGFATEDERRVFASLLEVSGIGPRVALSLCSCLPPGRFRRALQDDDVAAIAAVPGIGRKTASRVLLDLKDKLVAVAPAGAAPAPAEARARAASALENLGLSPSEARAAVERVDGDAGDAVEDLVRAALRELA